MRILFHLGHPAHFHLFKNVICSLQDKGHRTFILIKKKDVLEDLLRDSGLDYKNILPEGRSDSKVGIAVGQLKQDVKLFQFALKNKPDLLVGTSVAISHVGRLLKIPSLNVNEDDAEVVPLYAKLSYPWATQILAPGCCSVGKWKNKKVSYNSYHELAYLHPNNFAPLVNVVEKYFSSKENYFIIRFAKLSAHHDEGIKGINTTIAKRIVSVLEPYGKVYITSERILEPELEKYRIRINPLDIHHVIAYAQLYIGDSQTMAAEAGVLGVPFIRFNDFVGRIGYLKELEEKYELGYGIRPDNPALLFEKIEELLRLENRKRVFQGRRQKMLSDKIDYAEFLIWFIENYPQSVRIIQENTDYKYKFN